MTPNGERLIKHSCVKQGLDETRKVDRNTAMVCQV